MRVFAALIICFMSVMFANTFAHANSESSLTTFIGSFDIPIQEGLLIDEDQFVELDKPDGQISEYTAMGSMSVESVLMFYQAAMPPLGWQLTKKTAQDLSFSRGSENVVILVSQAHVDDDAKDQSQNREDQTVVTFRIMATNS